VNKDEQPKGTEIRRREIRMPGEMAKHFFEAADMDTPVIVRE
jgi:hypothetical protein